MAAVEARGFAPGSGEQRELILILGDHCWPPGDMNVATHVNVSRQSLKLKLTSRTRRDHGEMLSMAGAGSMGGLPSVLNVHLNLRKVSAPLLMAVPTSLVWSLTADYGEHHVAPPECGPASNLTVVLADMITAGAG